MTVESFLNFLFKHNTTIIEGLIAAILVLLVLLALRLFLGGGKKEEASAGSSSLGEIEASLKKILEQSSHVPANSQISEAVATENPEAANLVEEINKLKSELSDKAKLVEELQATAAAAPSVEAGAGGAEAGMSADEKAKLEAQIAELQAKLSEYEIISEDIADLSFYKEQNAKLTKELEALKSGKEAPAQVAATPPPPPAEEPKAPATDEAASAPATAPAAPEAAAKPAEPATPAQAAPKAEPEIVGKAKATPPPEDLEKQAAEMMAQPAKKEEPAADNVVDENLLAEFNAAVESHKTSAVEVATEVTPPATPKAEGEISLGDMDMEKMMAEAATITSGNAPEITAEQALGETLDEKKLLQEAAALEKVSAEDKKLMGDFENFVKKGS